MKNRLKVESPILICLVPNKRFCYFSLFFSYFTIIFVVRNVRNITNFDISHLLFRICQYKILVPLNYTVLLWIDTLFNLETIRKILSSFLLFDKLEHYWCKRVTRMQWHAWRNNFRYNSYANLFFFKRVGKHRCLNFNNDLMFQYLYFINIA